MLRYSLGQEEGAGAIERAVMEVLKRYRTADLKTEGDGTELVGCERMGELVSGLI